MVESGARYLGDDRVLLRRTPSGVEVCSFPLPFRLTETTLRALPRLRASAAATDEIGKVEVDPRRAFPGRHARVLERPILLLHPFRGQKTTLSPLSPAEALTRLLVQSGSLVLPEHPGAQEHLDLLRDLIATAASAELELSPAWLRDPDLAARQLLEVASSWPNARRP